jgi:hypothetical protein
MRWTTVVIVGALMSGAAGCGAADDTDSAGRSGETANAAQGPKGLSFTPRPRVTGGFAGSIAATTRGKPEDGVVNVTVNTESNNRRLTVWLYTTGKSKMKLLLAVTPGRVQQRTSISIKQLGRYDRVGIFGVKDPRKRHKNEKDVRVLSSISVKKLLGNVMSNKQY